METLNCICARRSIRRFTEEPISDCELEKIIEAVRMAPSWANTQCVELVLIRDPDRKRALQACLPQGNPAFKGMVQAPVLIALCAKRETSGFYKGQAATQHGDWFLFDAGIAAQNLCLAAWDLGYGTVHVGLLDHARAAEMIGLPDGWALVELIPIGRPLKQPQAPARKEVSELVHRERFGSH